MKCCDLTAGKLRIAGALQRLTKTPDGGGGYSTTWNTYATVRMHFAPLSGGERIAADRIEATTKNRAYIRYRNDVREADRLLIPSDELVWELDEMLWESEDITWDARAYQIRAALNLEMRNQWLELDLDGGVAT